MNEVYYENGVLDIDGDRYLLVRDTLISKGMISVDKNVYTINFFGSKLPKELRTMLANTYWIRFGVAKKNEIQPIESSLVVAL